MQALFIASTGMEAQEQNVNIISNNIANMRTTGYKRQRAEFQDLLYQEIRRAGGTIDRASGAVRGTRLAVADYRGNPVITATIEGHETSQAVFDLGNGSGILIGRAFARRNGLDAPDRIVGQADGGGLGGTIRRDRIVLRDLTVGSRTFHNVPAEIDDTETAADVNLGTAVLGNFIITTDFAQHALWLEPRE